MTVQTVLFFAGVLLLVAAVVCGVIALVMFFTKNIRDIHDDLTGKKRAKAIAEMEEETPASRRRARGGVAPASAAAAVAASVARNAREVNMNEVQATVSKRPKASSESGTGERAENSKSVDNARTVVTNGDESATVVNPAASAQENTVTTVAGIGQAPVDEAVVCDTAEPQEFPEFEFKVVRKIVLADSSNFVK